MVQLKTKPAAAVRESASESKPHPSEDKARPSKCCWPFGLESTFLEVLSVSSPPYTLLPQTLFLFVCLFLFVWLVGFWLFETGFLYIALAVLESLCRSGWPRTQKSTCLCLPSAGIKGVRHHCPAHIFISKQTIRLTLLLFSALEAFFLKLADFCALC